MARSKNTQRTGFEDRMARIKKGGANTMGEVHVGPIDEAKARKGKADNTVRMKKKKQKKQDLTGGSTVALMPLGVLLGGLAMFVGQATDYQLFQEGGLLNLGAPIEAAEPYMQYAPFLIGGILALMFAWTFRLTSFFRFAALAGGFVATFVYQTEVMRAIPFMYVNFFSKEYVQAALSAV